jgi:hypothetical protein
LFNLIILASTGSELDKITDASLTISLINLLGSLANEILFKSKIKKKKNIFIFSIYS